MIIRPYEEDAMEEAKRKHRRSIRWFAYDYAQAGVYFVTICTHRRQCLFGRVVEGAMELNAAGQAVAKCWRAVPVHYPDVMLDAFVVMPNHVHGILMILRDLGATVGANHYPPLPTDEPAAARDDVGANDDSPVPGRARGTSRTVGAIVRGFKIGMTKWMRQNTDVRDAWQRNYYEHVIRGERQLSRIRRYIADNPANWMLDHENPQGNCYGQSEKQQFFCY
jgi:REP element-mobilizing transposase RayT